MDYAWKDWKTGGKTVAQNFNAFEDSKLGIPVCSMHLLAVKWVWVGARGVTELFFLKTSTLFGESKIL